MPVQAPARAGYLGKEDAFMGYIMKNFTGACPETNRVQTISVKFEEIRAAGAARPDCKALGFYCGYAR